MLYLKSYFKKIRSKNHNFFFLGMLFLLFIWHLFFSAVFPLTPDEAYYWIWSKGLQLGYPDHPPMIAYWIKAGTFIFGDTPLGIRFFCVLASGLSVIFIWKSGHYFFDSHHGRWAGWIFSATLFFNIEAVTATPDSPAVFFLTLGILTLSWILRINSEKKSLLLRGWIILGCAFGLALLSKYTSILPIIGLIFALSLYKSEFFLNKYFYVGAGITFLIITPNILWNFTHGGGAITGQGRRFFSPDGHILSNYAELIGGQLALVTPFIFICVFLALFRLKKSSRFLAIASLPGFLFFFLYPLHARVQANWPCVLWPLLLLVGAKAPSFWKKIGIFSGGLIALGIYVQALYHLIPLEPHYDITRRQAEGWQKMAETLKKNYLSKDVLGTENYGLGSILAYYLPEKTIGTNALKFAHIHHMRTTVEHVRMIRETQEEPQVGEERICRYAEKGPQKEIRCYIIGKEETKKISLFP